MNIHLFFKFLSIVVHYGWFGLAYGILFSLLLQEDGFDALWLKLIVCSATVAMTVGVAYRTEMRYHMPTYKYIAIVAIALSGFLGCVKYPLLSLLFFGLFLAAIVYRCKDCVAFTKGNP